MRSRPARSCHRRRDRPGRLADARQHGDDRSASSQMTVFRPLVGMDKERSSPRRERLGTFDISIEPRSGLVHAVHAAASRKRMRSAG
ncbi:MAG: hypothetical protein WKG07_46350 [Hymenobacter sp.]